MKGQTYGNARNSYWDDKNEPGWTLRVSNRSTTGRSYRKGNRWVDSQVVEREKSITSPKVVEFGSEGIRAVMRRLAEEGRPGTCRSLGGEVLMVVGGENGLVKMPGGVQN